MTTTANRVVAENGDLRNKKDPDEKGRAKRRTFEAGFKLRVLEEWDRADAPERSAILRREGIYSSMISDWKRQRREGLLDNDGSRRPEGRGGPPTPRSTGSAVRTNGSRKNSPRRSS